MVLGYAGSSREESGQPGKMTKKKTGKRGRPVKSISDRYDEQEIDVDTLIRGFEPKWFAANQGNFLNPAGRKKLLMEVKRLREEAKNSLRLENLLMMITYRGYKQYLPPPSQVTHQSR